MTRACTFGHHGANYTHSAFMTPRGTPESLLPVLPPYDRWETVVQ